MLRKYLDFIWSSSAIVTSDRNIIIKDPKQMTLYLFSRKFTYLVKICRVIFFKVITITIHAHKRSSMM